MYLEMVEMLYIFLGVVFTDVYTFDKIQTISFKWVCFTICKLHYNNFLKGMAIDKIDKIKWDQRWQESFKKDKKIRQISDDINQGCQKEPGREVEHVR